MQPLLWQVSFYVETLANSYFVNKNTSNNSILFAILVNPLSIYIKKFSKLRAARVKGYVAPHKPILLLCVIDGMANGTIRENKIYITAELVARFKDYWHQLAIDPMFTANFSLPFYHLKSEGFWTLKTHPGRELLLTSSHSIKSFSHLKEVVDYACLDEGLYQLLLDEGNREVLR